MPAYGSPLYWVQTYFQDQFGWFFGPGLLTILIVVVQLGFCAGALIASDKADRWIERRKAKIAPARDRRIRATIP